MAADPRSDVEPASTILSVVTELPIYVQDIARVCLTSMINDTAVGCKSYADDPTCFNAAGKVIQKTHYTLFLDARRFSLVLNCSVFLPAFPFRLSFAPRIMTLAGLTAILGCGKVGRWRRR